ncbi:MAG: Spy/CpxP family protein refolding chaperone [SAR324 cluster bacterium]|nr:Spy/CpxP family protein refolding chaperone [SAR324 cluster bacterium]
MKCKNRKRRFFYRFSLLWLLIGTIGLAGCRKTPEKRAEWVVDHIADELELTEEQSGHLNQIKTEFLEKRTQWTSVHKNVMDLAVEQMKAETVEQEKWDQLVGNTQQKTGDAIEFFRQKYVEFYQMLTPEQRMKAAELMEKHRERIEKYHNH